MDAFAIAAQVVVSILPCATKVRLYKTSTTPKTDDCDSAIGSTIQQSNAHDVDIANCDEEAEGGEGATHNSGYGGHKLLFNPTSSFEAHGRPEDS